MISTERDLTKLVESLLSIPYAGDRNTDILLLGRKNYSDCYGEKERRL